MKIVSNLMIVIYTSFESQQNCFTRFLHPTTSKELKMYFAGSANYDRSGLTLFSHRCKVGVAHEQWIYTAVKLT